MSTQTRFMTIVNRLERGKSAATEIKHLEDDLKRRNEVLREEYFRNSRYIATLQYMTQALATGKADKAAGKVLLDSAIMMGHDTLAAEPKKTYIKEEQA